MPQSGIVKYHVKLSYEVDGHVERADIIGAIFGQTEGLLGPEMNLNELQRLSKIGRIEVNTTNATNPARGTTIIPMSTDIDICALIAAAIESIDKVGPFDCKFSLEAIDDVRAAKKDDIVRRAKEIKQRWATKTVSEGENMLKDVHEGEHKRVESYGPSRLPCSNGIYDSPWIILVEGRADIINLLRAGYDNALAINGAAADESIRDLCSKKENVVAFLDGDRAGGLILKKLKSIIHVDIELRADTDLEVEEITPQRVDEILRPVADKLNARRSRSSSSSSSSPSRYSQPSSRSSSSSSRSSSRSSFSSRSSSRSQSRRPSSSSSFSSSSSSSSRSSAQHKSSGPTDADKPIVDLATRLHSTINETLEAVALDGKNDEVFRVAISELVSKLSTQSGIRLLVLDGIITQRLLDGAKNAGVGCIIGHRIAKLGNVGSIKLWTFEQIGIST